MLRNPHYFFMGKIQTFSLAIKTLQPGLQLPINFSVIFKHLRCEGDN